MKPTSRPLRGILPMIACVLAVLLGSSVAEGTTTRPDAFGPVLDTQLALGTALKILDPAGGRHQPQAPRFEIFDYDRTPAWFCNYDESLNGVFPPIGHYDDLDPMFPAPTNLSGTSGRNHKLFQGAWTDPDTGIAYHRNRWYDPRTANWLSEDPLGAVDSPNLYAFVGWGPQSYRDPMGDCRWNDVACWLYVKQDFELTMTEKVVGGGAKLIGQGVYGLADKVTFGGLSRMEAGAEEFFVAEGSLVDRGNAAQQAGNKAAVDSMTFGFSGAEDKTQHATNMLHAALGTGRYETGISQMYEGCASRDWELCTRGGGELIGGVSQTILTVAGVAETGMQGFKLFRSSRVPGGRTFRDAGGRLRNPDGTFAFDGGPKSRATRGTHGNTAGDQPATLYERYDADDNFLKHGVSQDTSRRYTQSELDGGYLIETQAGPRREILKIERELVETNPGPLNKEPWAGRRKN